MEPGVVPDHYECLGVSPQAPPEVVRAAYLALAKLHHPDGPTPDEERMKQVNQAWNVLRVPAERAAYDAERARWAAAPTTPEPPSPDPFDVEPPWAEDDAGYDTWAATSWPGDADPTPPPDDRPGPGGRTGSGGRPGVDGRDGRGDASGFPGFGGWDRTGSDGWGEPTLGRSGWGETALGQDGWGEASGVGSSPGPAGAGAGWDEGAWDGAGRVASGWGETVDDDPWGPASAAAAYPDARFAADGGVDPQWDDGEEWELALHDPTAVLGRRAAAYVVDVAVVGLPVLALVAVATVPLQAAGVVAGVLFAAVHVVLEGRTGSTPGKALFRVRTVRQSGEAPGVVRALVRSVLWVVDSFPWLVPAVGYHMAQRSGGHRRLGDLAARTFVVRREDAGYPLVTVAPEDLEELVTGRG